MPRIHVPLFADGKKLGRVFERAQLSSILSEIIVFSVLYRNVSDYAHLIARTVLKRNTSRFKCDLYLEDKHFDEMIRIKNTINADREVGVRSRLDNIAQCMIAAEITKTCSLSVDKVLSEGSINPEHLCDYLENYKDIHAGQVDALHLPRQKFEEIQQKTKSNRVRVTPVGLNETFESKAEFNQLSRRVSSWVNENQKGKNEKPLAPELQAFLQM